MRTENCVCGGTITVPESHLPAPYVEGHNSTPSHFAWRVRNGYRVPQRPTVVTVAVTCPESGTMRPPFGGAG